MCVRAGECVSAYCLCVSERLSVSEHYIACVVSVSEHINCLCVSELVSVLGPHGEYEHIVVSNSTLMFSVIHHALVFTLCLHSAHLLLSANRADYLMVSNSLTRGAPFELQLSGQSHMGSKFSSII